MFFVGKPVSTFPEHALKSDLVFAQSWSSQYVGFLASAADMVPMKRLGKRSNFALP